LLEDSAHAMPDMARPLAEDMVLENVGRALGVDELREGIDEGQRFALLRRGHRSDDGVDGVRPSETSFCNAFCAAGLSGLPLVLTSAKSRSER
jgi:hypothetical protein